MAERDRLFTKHPKTTFIAGALRLARQRPGARSARCSTRSRTCTPRSARCSTTSAASRAPRTILRQVPGPHPVRQGQLPARRISVLLARVRNHRRVLRLLPRLPRVLEAVRHRPARRGAEEALLPERAEADARPAARPASRTNCRHSTCRRRMASYLVTGGAGFIGSHLAEELVRRGHTVRVVDSLITGKRRNLEHICRRRVPRRRPRRPGVAHARGGRAWTTCCTRRRFRRCRARSRIRSPRTAPTSTRRSTCWSPRATPASSASSTPARRRPTATRRRCPSARTCRPTRCRRTRCRSWSASSTARCSRGSTASRR